MPPKCFVFAFVPSRCAGIGPETHEHAPEATPDPSRLAVVRRLLDTEVLDGSTRSYERLLLAYGELMEQDGCMSVERMDPLASGLRSE